MPAPIARWRLGDIPGTIEYARQALALAAEDDQIRRTQATALLGIAEYASGDLQAAERSLLAFQASMWQAGDIATAIGITFVLANIELAQGRLREAVSAYRASPATRAESGRHGPSARRIYTAASANCSVNKAISKTRRSTC